MSVFKKGKKWVLLVDSKWNKFGIHDDIEAGFGNRPSPETEEQIYSGRNEDFSGARGQFRGARELIFVRPLDDVHLVPDDDNRLT